MFIFRKAFLLCITFILFFAAHYMVGCDNTDERALAPIVQDAQILRHKASPRVPIVIALAGNSAVGKSYCADQLAALLGECGVTVSVLRHDDFLDPDSEFVGGFHPRLHHEAIHRVMQAIKLGDRVVEKLAWNPMEKRPPSKTTEEFVIEGVNLIVIEGEYALCAEEPYDFRQYADLTVFIDADDDDILDWNWKRGRRDTQNTTEELFKELNRRNLKQTRKNIDRVSQGASYVIHKGSDHRYTVIKKGTSR